MSTQTEQKQKQKQWVKVSNKVQSSTPTSPEKVNKQPPFSFSFSIFSRKFYETLFIYLFILNLILEVGVFCNRANQAPPETVGDGNPDGGCCPSATAATASSAEGTVCSAVQVPLAYAIGCESRRWRWFFFARWSTPTTTPKTIKIVFFFFFNSNRFGVLFVVGDVGIDGNGVLDWRFHRGIYIYIGVSVATFWYSFVTRLVMLEWNQDFDLLFWLLHFCFCYYLFVRG